MPNVRSYETALERSNQTQRRSCRASGSIHDAHRRPSYGPPASGTLFRHAQRARRAAEHGREDERAYRGLPGHHRPRHNRAYPGQRVQHGHGLPRLRHRPCEDHDLRAFCRACRKPAHAAVPLARERSGAAAQPHGQSGDGSERPRAHGASPHLPRAPGVRHPLLQGQRRARGTRSAAAHRAHAPYRAQVQQPLRPRVPRGDALLPRRRCCPDSTAAR